VHYVVRWKGILFSKYHASGIWPAGRVVGDEETFGTKTNISKYYDMYVG
jgi:hypothetical protein